MRELTEAEFILADIILLKIEHNTDFRMQRYLHNVTIGLHDTKPENIYKEICDIVTLRSSVIEDFLRTQGYIRFTDPSTHLYVLTQKGEDAQQQGSHQQYLDWVAREKRKKGFEDFPKKKWHIYEPLKWLLFLVAGIAIERYLLKGCGQENPQDKGKVTEQSTSQQTPKSLEKKADVHVLDSTHYQDMQVTTKHK